ncbi:MAG: head GIN domain-containing protein [Bacteroidales bacterium]
MEKFKIYILATILMITGLSVTQAMSFDAAAKNYEKEYQISNIRGIDLLIDCELYIVQGNDESLRIEADKEIFDRLTVDQDDSTLLIKTDKKKYNHDKWNLKLYLSIQDLRKIKIGGAVKLETKGTLKSSKLTVDISGAADIDMDMEVEKLLADFSGAVNADLRGLADYVAMDMSGASNVNADNLKSRAFYLDFSGFGKADIYAEEVVKIDMSGMGVVKYGGNPDRVETSSSGFGIVKAR